MPRSSAARSSRSRRGTSGWLSPRFEPPVHAIDSRCPIATHPSLRSSSRLLQPFVALNRLLLLKCGGMIQPEHFECLGSLTALTHLTVDFETMHDGSGPGPASMQHMDDAGLAHLKSLTKLEELFLSFHPVWAAGALTAAACATSAWSHPSSGLKWG